MIELGTVFIAIAAWCGNPSDSSVLAGAWRTHSKVQDCRDSLVKCLGVYTYPKVSPEIFSKCFKDEVFK
jgi:hypothetical protein